MDFALKTVLKRFAGRVLTTRTYAKLLLAHDQAAVAVGYSLLANRRQARDAALLIAPEGEGNLGDQAMFNAVLARTEGQVRVVTLGANALDIPDRPDVEVVSLPRAIRGAPILRVPDVTRFGRELRRANAVMLPGADTLDGGHPHFSLTRLNLVHCATTRGVPTVVQGFSWSDKAPRSILAAIAGSGAKLIPRDPVSHRRLAAAGVDSDAGADVVFSYHDTEALPDDLARFFDDSTATGPIALLNTSGLIHRKHDLIPDYRKIVAHLHGLGYRVVFTPHVIRPSDDDLALARRVHAEAGAPSDYLINQLLRPQQVKTLVTRADLCLTGRMHLAIQSLNHGLPVATLATAGKVEGLYEFFDLPELVLEPVPGFGPEAIRVVSDLHERGGEIRRKIEQALPQVRALSLRNFADGVVDDEVMTAGRSWRR